MCINYTFDFPKWWLEMDWSLRHFQLCPGFSAVSQCRHTHLPWKEHGMSCSVFHWKFQLKYSALNYCFLSNFSLHFFEIDASTKLDFFNAKYLTFLGGGGEIKSNFNLHFLHLSFSWPWTSLVTFCMCATNCRLCRCIDMFSLLLWVIQLLWSHKQSSMTCNCSKPHVRFVKKEKMKKKRNKRLFNNVC